MFAITILAAGSSSRMGKPKQNLVFMGMTLLQRNIIEAKRLTDHVIVIVGAAQKEILPTLNGLNVKVLHNENWDKGMATSITLAIKHVLGFCDNITGIIFLLCDQPFVSTGLLNELAKVAGNTEKGIIGCAYSETIGVPAYFKKKYFLELLKLTGTEGAKKLIEKFADDVQTIPFAAGDIDIDTPQDYEKLLSGQ